MAGRHNWNFGIVEYWVLGIWQNAFTGQIIMTKNSIRYLPLNPSFQHSIIPTLQLRNEVELSSYVCVLMKRYTSLAGELI
jgi:hypothetical protein